MATSSQEKGLIANLEKKGKKALGEEVRED